MQSFTSLNAFFSDNSSPATTASEKYPFIWSDSRLSTILDGLISGVCVYKSRITNKKLNLGSSFNSLNIGSWAIAGKASKALKILITALTLTGILAFDRIDSSDSNFLNEEVAVSYTHLTLPTTD